MAGKPSKPVPPTSILVDAQQRVFGDRAEAYGHPTDNFQNIADLWNAYINIKVRADDQAELNQLDVAALNILQKVARVAINQQHLDSWLDIAGYAATADRVIRKF